jgi:hypothetical protein
MKGFVATNFRKHAINPFLVLHQIFESFILIHSGFANHGVHFLFNFIHEFVSALIFTKLNAESRKGNLLCRLVHVIKQDFSRSPFVRNQPNISSYKFLNNVSATNNLAGQVKGTFAVPETNCAMVVGSSASSGLLSDR